MKRRLLFLILILASLYSNAQRVVDVTRENVNAMALSFSVGGEPFSTAKYIQVVEGTPYFHAGWMRGSLMLSDSNEYINMLLRLDLLGNNVEYIDKTGQQLVATSVIREIRLTDSLGQSYHFIHSGYIGAKDIEAGWYQLLAAGKVSLYKKIVKEVLENKPYGSATTEQKINNREYYFLQKGAALSRIKKFKDLPDMLTDKKTALSAMISTNKLSGKADQDYTALVSLYNQ